MSQCFSEESVEVVIFGHTRERKRAWMCLCLFSEEVVVSKLKRHVRFCRGSGGGSPVPGEGGSLVV